jgi:plasmid maintenance system killer protein
MDFRIADTFATSLAKLTATEQRAAKTTAFDLQLNPAAPGHSFHKLDRAQDKAFWSVRVNDDIRIIVHRAAGSLLLAYVDHHDKAYRWAERRRIEAHPTTGAMQLVEVRERVEEVAAPPAAPAAKRPFADLRKPELMAFGVPADWVEDVRNATDDTLLGVLAHLPQEASEALLRFAVGEKPAPPPPPPADPYAHPDAQRRFRVLHDVEELRRALDFPWHRWAVFLHPTQRALVERRFAGPARVTGSAGTGKTIVALHRAVHLARRDGKARVLLTTFSKPLARVLAARLASLVQGAEVAQRISVKTLQGAAHDLYAAALGQPSIASPHAVESLLLKAASDQKVKIAPAFVSDEWWQVVDARQARSWEAYRDAPRIGRKMRLAEKQRRALWGVFAAVQAGLAAQEIVTWAEVFSALTARVEAGKGIGFDHVVVDEAQDLSMPEARFLGAVAGSKPDGLFFAGDLGQRIFQQAFSWKALGLDVRGRSHTLRLNYRTSHQIRAQADGLLPDAVKDVDGEADSRKGTVSLFDGPTPEVQLFKDAAAEHAAVGSWIAARVAGDVAPEEIAVLVRSPAQLGRARAAVKASGCRAVEFDEKAEVSAGAVSISVMHLAKGLEFRAVAVMACDEDVLPLEDRVEAVTDPSDLEEVHDTERHLLYVACTRARDFLWVSGVTPGSEFLRDLKA